MSRRDSALALKAADPSRTLQSIAAELGVTHSAVSKWLHPERAKGYYSRDHNRNARNRAYANNHRAHCKACGKPMKAASMRADGRRVVGDDCAACRQERRVQSLLRMLALRVDEGLGNAEIARRVSRPVKTVAQELHRLREIGFDVPADPRARRPLTESPVVTPEAEGLRRAFAARGLLPGKA